MSLLETNIIILNNGQKAKYSYTDDWSRKIYTLENGNKAVLLDDEVFYSITSSYGEPCCPLKKEYQPKNIEIYRFEDQVISLGDWDNYFEPVMVEDEGEKQFDSYKEAWIYADKKYNNTPYQHIWAVIDGENGKLIALNGNHLVNVLHFIVCAIPWGTGEDSDSSVYLEVAYEE